MKGLLCLLILMGVGGEAWGQWQEAFDHLAEVKFNTPNKSAGTNFLWVEVSDTDNIVVGHDVNDYSLDQIDIPYSISLRFPHIAGYIYIGDIAAPYLSIYKQSASNLNFDESEFGGLHLNSDTISAIMLSNTNGGKYDFKLMKSDVILVSECDLKGLLFSGDSIGSVTIENSRIRKFFTSRDEPPERGTDDLSDHQKKETTIMKLSATASDFDTVSFHHTNLSEKVSFVSSVINAFASFDGITADTIVFNDCPIINDLQLRRCLIGDLILNKTLLRRSTIEDCIVQRRLSLHNLIIDKDEVLDLKELYPDPYRPHRRRILVDFRGVAIKKLRLKWKNCTLDPDFYKDPNEIMSTYQSLLNNFKENDQLEDVELLDKEYTSYRYQHYKLLSIPLGAVWDRVSWAFWDYGYDRARVFLWMILAPLFYALLAVGYYRRMHEEVYRLDNFTPLAVPARKRTLKVKLRHWWRQYWRSFNYVVVVFYAFSIRFEHLRYRNKGLLAFFLLIYISGTLGLFFIVNYLFKV